MKTRYENFMKEYDFFTDRVKRLADIKIEINNYEKDGSYQNIEFNDKLVSIDYYVRAHCGCCPGETYYLEFNTEDITNNFEDYKNKLIKEKEEKIEAEKKRKEEEKKKEKREKEKRDRDEYERLQKKFGGK
jgi:NADH:ubiquinone oxidoreductase subunit B-like Fe-S oxidoreductase